jgi:small subunit ribosomal protein S8e
MPRWHRDTGKKLTGGQIRLARGKRKYEMGSTPTHTRLGEVRRRVVRTRGGGLKVRVLSTKFVNVFIPRTRRTRRVEILDVMENPADPHLVRRGIITKGCVVKTELGLVRLTSRPSQHGVANGVLIERA